MLDDGPGAHRADQAEHPGADARRSGCGTGRTPPAGSSCRPGNMSEKAVGYTTVGGDLMGALGVLANVPKTVVMYLLDYLLEKTGYEGIGQVLEKPSRAGAGPEPGGRGGADALPDPGRLLPPLRRREAASRRDRGGAGGDVPRVRAGAAAGTWVESSPGSSCSRSTSGCSRRSPCTSATSIWTGSGRCSCRWCRIGVGLRGRRLTLTLFGASSSSRRKMRLKTATD